MLQIIQVLMAKKHVMGLVIKERKVPED